VHHRVARQQQQQHVHHLQQRHDTLLYHVVNEARQQIHEKWEVSLHVRTWKTIE
jgi:hypothetical protein